MSCESAPGGRELCPIDDPTRRADVMHPAIPSGAAPIIQVRSRHTDNVHEQTADYAVSNSRATDWCPAPDGKLRSLRQCH